MKIIVLGGGKSTERAVSLRSASAVAKNLKLAGFNVEEIDPDEDMPEAFEAEDIVFPILHGQGGEDGTIQKILERSHQPYLGSDSEASITCFDKHLTRSLLSKKGIPIANGGLVTLKTYFSNDLIHKPHVLKVARGGSSIGTYIVRNPSNIDKDKVNEVFKLDKKAVIEELVVGVEVTVSILDTKALPVIEIVPPEQEDFDYQNKYNGKTKEICPPSSISQEVQEKAQRLAEKTHKALGARHLSRIDIIVRPNGELVVLELNTIPGMTEQSLYPLAAKVSGLTMPTLMKKFVELVKRDYHIRT